MAHTTTSKEVEENKKPDARSVLHERAAATLRSPGLYLGSGLGLASGALSGDPLLYTSLAASGTAAAWTVLGMHPGPWRWLPGAGEPWEWLCRSGRRGYRRSLRRMRRRLEAQHDLAPTVGTDGLLVPTLAGGEGWYGHPSRAALVRKATAETRRARCELLRTVWQRALPDWERGWWRRYSPAEMALRAGPLAALPASGAVDLPWWARTMVVSLGSAWGAWVAHRPDPATAPKKPAADAAWYEARWAEWIACERGPLPGSYLAELHVDGDRLTAVIVSTTARPALVLDQDTISIAFEVPPRAVNLYRPSDMAASRAKVTVKLAQLDAVLDEDDLAAVWAEYTPYPGSELYDVETTEFGRRFMIRVPRKGAAVTDVQPRGIAQTLDLEGEEAVDRLHLRALDARRVEVNEMTINPLQGGVPLDTDALTMDEQGYISVGQDIYGQDAKWRLLKFDPARRGLSGAPSASAVHSFGSGTTGAGKTSLEEDLQVAQRKNGFVSWLADGKGGAGYASWVGDLDWLVKSSYGAMVMAQSANAVSEYRYAEQMKLQWLDAEGYTEDGRSFFVPWEPFAPMSITWDEFNEMVLKNPQAPHVKPLLRGVSSVGRLSRAAGISARIWVQIPNLDSIGTDASANAIRDMLQSGNIALFRTARADVDVMSLGSRTPEFRLAPLPERFPDGSETGGLFYIADGKSQYTQSRAAFHTNPARISRQFPATTLTDAEAEVAGAAYLRRGEYQHLDAGEEEEFLRELDREEQAQHNTNAKVVDLAAARPTPQTDGAAEDEDDEPLDEIAPPTRSQLVWHAVHDGARRNKHIAEATGLKPPNVAGGTKRLERLGKLRQINRDWHTASHVDA